MEKVFVAMSGGMDSSFAAYLLKGQGYDVVGITFELLPKSLKNINNPKACCSLETVKRAQKVARDLSIPHYVINLREEFEHLVIERFIEEYKAGRTPNPCMLCNKHIKFAAFVNKAVALGADKVATGHYALIEEAPAGWQLKKGRDRTKDQSYFLYPIKKDLLKKVLLPLGETTKKGLKEKAHLIQWDSERIRESQDICFIPEQDYRGFISNFVPTKKGPAYHVDGRLLGYHNGIHLYTVGQRRGIGIPFKEPLYVVEIRSTENTLILGTKEHLKNTGLIADDLNFFDPVAGGTSGRVRYRQNEVPCTYKVSGDTMDVRFEEPLYAITPGQSVVLYQEDRVIGGGVIKRSFDTPWLAAR
jgi:tRNA-uridine 2-sulfurtransferase